MCSAKIHIDYFVILIVILFVVGERWVRGRLLLKWVLILRHYMEHTRYLRKGKNNAQ